MFEGKSVEKKQSFGTRLGYSYSPVTFLPILVVAKKDILVTGFSVMSFAATTATIEVYKLKEAGSFVGEEHNPDAWTLIGSTTIDTLDNRPTPLPPGTISDVAIRSGATQSFYVTFHSDTNYNRYSRASTYGEVNAENSDLQFKVVSCHCLVLWIV